MKKRKDSARRWIRAVGLQAMAIGAGVLMLSSAAAAGIGDESDGSQSHPVHIINLLTEAEEGEQGSVITPEDEPLLPFSPRQTCGDCHDYEAISQGWHFNAHDPCVDHGFPGQPWILTDRLTATQLPLSYRPWPGVYAPQAIGMNYKEFLVMFGRHLPGGGIGELEDPEAKPAEIMRSMVSGKLEINCMACHDGEAAHNQAEAKEQLQKENLRWAATATCGFAWVEGSAKDMSDMWDPFLGEAPEDPKKKPPKVGYDKSRFLDKNTVFIDVRKEPAPERCYFCHSNSNLSHAGADHWKGDEDIHLTAGLKCVDCHRNGQDHKITRGYRGEPRSEDEAVSTLSCEGCHLGEGDMHRPIAGRLGAPQPDHKGIPTVHFEKLTCTACHSGPWPEATTQQMKTSRAHGLGTQRIIKAPEALPHIQYPVYRERPDGKIGPHKLFWPAFWGRLNEDAVTPLHPDEVKKAAEDVLPDIQANKDALLAGDWPAFKAEDVTNVLKALAGDEGEAVYVAGGKLHRLDKGGALQSISHEAAAPSAWSLGHNVRPASQSLGIGGAVGCSHCHTTKAPFFFGEVAVDTPVVGVEAAAVRMVDLQESVDGGYIWAFNMSFVFRPWMKMTVLAASAILAGFLLWYGLRALGCLARAAAGKHA